MTDAMTRVRQMDSEDGRATPKDRRRMGGGTKTDDTDQVCKGQSATSDRRSDENRGWDG
jgi:hypothetical protein